MAEKLAKLPIGEKGDNAINSYKYGVKLGYRAYFDLKTLGTASKDIEIIPKIYYVDKNGNQKEVDLYYRTSKTEYKKLENLIKYKVICKILEDFYQDDLMLINDSHVALIESLINCKKSNSYVYLPNDVIAIKSYNELTVKKNTDDLYEYEIEFDKYAGLPNGHTIEKIESIDSNDNNICRIDKTEVAFPLHIRTRKAGDKMKLKKLNGSKKVKDIFIDSKIQIDQRDKWPINIRI